MSKRIALDHLRDTSRKRPMRGLTLIQSEHAEDCRTLANVEWPVPSAMH
jgi:hypothetical protein